MGTSKLLPNSMAALRPRSILTYPTDRSRRFSPGRLTLKPLTIVSRCPERCVHNQSGCRRAYRVNGTLARLALAFSYMEPRFASKYQEAESGFLLTSLLSLETDRLLA